MSVCLSVCLSVYQCVCSAKSAKSRQYDDSVATVGDADMKFGRCVLGTKMHVEFEDMSTSTQLLLRAQCHFLIRIIHVQPSVVGGVTIADRL